VEVKKKAFLIDDIKECQFALNTLQNDHLSACLKWEFFVFLIILLSLLLQPADSILRCNCTVPYRILHI